MKQRLLALILLWPLAGQAAETRTEVQFGFPNLLALRLDRPLATQWRVGLMAGWLPVSLLTAFYRPEVASNFSDEFDFKLDLGAHAFSTGLFAEWNPSDYGRSFFRFELLVNTIDASAKAYIVNRDTSARAPYADFQATAVLPRFAVTYGRVLSQSESSKWMAGLGVTLLLPKAFFLQRTGPASAYFEAVPSVRDSVQDGLTNAEADISALLSNTIAGAWVLPALWISAAW